MILATKEEIAAHTEAGWWGTETLCERFLANAAATPERTAVADPPNRQEIDGGAPERLTYRELENLTGRIATGFIDAGLKKGDVLAIQLPNTSSLVAAY